MMEIFKNGGGILKGKNGITMIQTVITIVMMILIAGFSIYNSKDTLVETKLTKAYNEILEVKRAVQGAETLELFKMSSIGTPVEDFTLYPQLSGYYNSGEHEYYFLNFKDNGKVIENVLEIRNIENNYIVNVKNTENIEIFMVNGVKVGTSTYYTDTEILKKYNDIFAGR